MELKDIVTRLLPEDERFSAEVLIEDFEHGDPEDFSDRYPEIVSGYDDMQTFVEEVEDQVVCLGTVLVWYLMERGVVMAVNWDGEEEENLFSAYVNYRLETLGEDFTVETEGFYRWAEKVHLDTSDGNLVWSLFQAVDQQLRLHGYCLLGFDTQCEPDSIYVGVFPQRLASGLLCMEITDVYIAAAEDL